MQNSNLKTVKCLIIKSLIFPFERYTLYVDWPWFDWDTREILGFNNYLEAMVDIHLVISSKKLFYPNT